MCGISGYIDNNNAIERETVVLKMNKAMAHRGPDASSLWSQNNITLGHARLSIIDLSSDGTQPMQCHYQRYTIVFNGEIYNFRELKQSVPNYPFKTQTDTEVLLALYHEHKNKLFAKLQGMFSLAIYDQWEQTLTLARDPLGKKPLYYYLNTQQGNHQLLFASEIRTLLAANAFPPNLNHQVLDNFLRFQTVFDPYTLVENILSFPSANFATFSTQELPETLPIESYWSYNSSSSYPQPKNYAEAVRTTRNLFYQAVEKRLVADVPFGAFLSGGIDSSAVVAAMANTHSQPINTFHISFNEKDFSEKIHAETVAKKFNTHHQTLTIQSDDFLQEIIPAVNAIDHPSADGPNTYIVSKITKAAGITMALSGLGGDELFGGYPIFKKLKQWQPWQSVGLAKTLEIIPTTTRKKIFPNNKLGQMLSLPTIDIASIYPLFREYFNTPYPPFLHPPSNPQHLLSWISQQEIENYMKPVLLRDTDQMSMAHALEIRVPFLDKDLVNYVLSLPDTFKPLHPGKKLLIDAMGDDLPQSVWNRKKMGFTFPWALWLNQELKPWILDGLNQTQDLAAVKPYLQTCYDSLSQPTNPHWHKTWLIATLGHWIQNNRLR